MPKFGHFESTSINFLILTKFPWCTISNTLISNLALVFEKCEQKWANLSIFGQEELSF